MTDEENSLKNTFYLLRTEKLKSLFRAMRKGIVKRRIYLRREPYESMFCTKNCCNISIIFRDAAKTSPKYQTKKKKKKRVQRVEVTRAHHLSDPCGNHSKYLK